MFLNCKIDEIKRNKMIFETNSVIFLRFYGKGQSMGNELLQHTRGIVYVTPSPLLPMHYHTVPSFHYLYGIGPVRTRGYRSLAFLAITYCCVQHVGYRSLAFLAITYCCVQHVGDSRTC
jgi:hypothetical protein